MSHRHHSHDADNPQEPKHQAGDPIADYKEWSDHRYDPGYFIGGRLPPWIRAYQRMFKPGEKRGLLVLLIIAGIAIVLGVIWALFR
jgi:hypothetical protein